MFDTSTAPWPINRKAAVGFAALACLCSLIAFSGWVFQSPVLRSFGVIDLPIFPLTALGYFALSLGFVAAIRGARGRARLLWAVPLLIAALSLIQNIGEIDLGTDRLLFPDTITGYGFAHPGRPGATPTTIFLLLSGAAYFSISRRWRRDEAASLIASGVLCMASATAVLILFTTPDDPISRLYRISVPSAVIALSLLAAFVLWQSGFGWVRLLGSSRVESRLLQTLLPAALLLPLVPSMLGFGQFIAQLCRCAEKCPGEFSPDYLAIAQSNRKHDRNRDCRHWAGNSGICPVPIIFAIYYDQE